MSKRFRANKGKGKKQQQQPVETITLDTTEEEESVVQVSDDSVVEVSASETPVKEKPQQFVPVREGGQKLDDTIELSDSSRLDASGAGDAAPDVKREPDDSVRYTTAVESNESAFQTPSAPRTAGGGRQTTSTPRDVFAANVATPAATVVSGAAAAKKMVSVEGQNVAPTASSGNGHFQHSVFDEIEDELHKTDDSIQQNDEPSPAEVSQQQQQQGARAGSFDSAISMSKSSSIQKPPATPPRGGGKTDSSHSVETDSAGGESLEDDLDLPKTCTVLTAPDGANVYLVGTAHFSKESQEDVAKVRSCIRS